MVTNVAALRVGRLLEVRVARGFTTETDVDVLFDAVDRETDGFGRAGGYVTIADWRHCPVMSPVAADRLAERIRRTNRRVDRSAALAHRDSPVAVLQFLRVIREANLPDRKLFFDAEQLVGWLAQGLTPAELRRLRGFLSEAVPHVPAQPDPSAPTGEALQTRRARR